MVAVLGDPPAFPHWPPRWPQTTEAIRRAIEAALHDNTWGTYNGVHTEQLEAALRAFYNVPYVMLVGSGTFGIELALRAIGVGAGDEVVLAAYDYPGNFLSVLAVGAHPVLVDVRPDDGQLDVDRLATAVSNRTKAVIASHLHGGLVAMRSLVARAHQAGLAVVEDAAQAPGAEVEGRRAGTWGDLGVISFGGSKLLSAGRGGAILCRDRHLYQRLRLLALRANNQLCPLSQLQAIVLVPQVRELEKHELCRHEAVQFLAERLAPLAVFKVLHSAVQGRPGYYKVGLLLDLDRLRPLDRPRLVRALRSEGIPIDVGFRALHVGRSPRRYRAAGSLHCASALHERLVVLHHTVLLEGTAALERMADVMAQVYEARDRIAKVL